MIVDKNFVLSCFWGIWPPPSQLPFVGHWLRAEASVGSGGWWNAQEWEKGPVLPRNQSADWLALGLCCVQVVAGGAVVLGGCAGG